MRENQKPRAKVRLYIEQGTVRLHLPGATTVSCVLVDLSESGCQCRATLEDPQTAQIWQQRLTLDTAVMVDLAAPPHLDDLRTNALIRWRRISEQTLDLGLSFSALDARQQEEVRQAMLAIAKEKLRTATVKGLGKLRDQELGAESPARR